MVTPPLINHQHRCLYLARCYSPLKKYAESLTLIQRAQLHLRETRSILSTLDAPSPSTSFYQITTTECDALDEDVTSNGASLKKDWFTFNAGAPSADNTGYKKPLFFDIALNYVELDMERLQERSGKLPTPTAPVPAKAVPHIQAPQPQKTPVAKAKAEDIVRPSTPEPSAARGGLGNILGGWWGRK